MMLSIFKPHTPPFPLNKSLSCTFLSRRCDCRLQQTFCPKEDIPIATTEGVIHSLSGCITGSFNQEVGRGKTCSLACRLRLRPYPSVTQTSADCWRTDMLTEVCARKAYASQRKNENSGTVLRDSIQNNCQLGSWTNTSGNGNSSFVDRVDFLKC